MESLTSFKIPIALVLTIMIAGCAKINPELWSLVSNGDHKPAAPGPVAGSAAVATDSLPGAVMTSTSGATAKLSSRPEGSPELVSPRQYKLKLGVVER